MILIKQLNSAIIQNSIQPSSDVHWIVYALLVILAIILAVLVFVSNIYDKNKKNEIKPTPAPISKPKTKTQQRIIRSDLNKAYYIHLLDVPGIGKILAERIIDERTILNGFKDMNELTAIKGINDSNLLQLQKYYFIDAEKSKNNAEILMNAKIAKEKAAKLLKINEDKRIETELKDSKEATITKEQADKIIVKKTPKKNKPLNLNYVNYDFEFINDNNYPKVIVPSKGTIIRSHRVLSTASKRRGYTELIFENKLRDLVPKGVQVMGNLSINTGNQTRPYEPDIAIIVESESNIRIDIEIDEPYAGISRQATHVAGEDDNRDIYFKERGWMVIRFTERQIHLKSDDCIGFIKSIISSIDDIIPNRLATNTPDVYKVVSLIESEWDLLQAQKWEKERYREKYLDHEFQKLENKVSITDISLNEQEKAEEEKVIGKIATSSFGIKSSSNKQLRDRRVSFDKESHSYKIDNVPAQSVTTIINKFFEEFDKGYWSAHVARRDGMTQAAVLKMWENNGKDSRDKGTLLHDQIDNYFKNKSIIRNEDYLKFERFIEKYPLKCYKSEWRIFDEDYNVAGTIDLLAIAEDGINMYDWKRSKKLISPDAKVIKENNYNKYGYGPCSFIDDTSYSKYVLQQSFYRYILEKHYNLEINKMFLVVIHPNYNKPYRISIPYWKDTIEEILEVIS